MGRRCGDAYDAPWHHGAPPRLARGLCKPVTDHSIPKVGTRWPACAAVVLLLGLSGGLQAAPPAERQSELVYRLKQDCGSCHGMTLKGGLGPPLLPATLSDKPDEALVEVILDGLPGTPMPPWSFEITPEEAAWLVRRIKEGL
jgi:cytochrome c55X